jgi:phosphoglucosamine mutase
LVVGHGADVGLAFDGDADRVQAVDSSGRLIDGDHLIALMALGLHSRGQLRGDAVVVTVMSNLGFHLAMRAANIEVVETPVGDRYVLDALEQRNLMLGGEQSGHLIFRDLAPTGDGLLAGLQVLAEVNRADRDLGAVADAAMTRLPQVLLNVEVTSPGRLAQAQAIWDAAGVVERELAGQGRVLLRPSGTEPLVRVMVEAPSALDAQRHAEHLAAVVREALA